MFQDHEQSGATQPFTPITTLRPQTCSTSGQYRDVLNCFPLFTTALLNLAGVLGHLSTWVGGVFVLSAMHIKMGGLWITATEELAFALLALMYIQRGVLGAR